MLQIASRTGDRERILDQYACTIHTWNPAHQSFLACVDELIERGYADDITVGFVLELARRDWRTKPNHFPPPPTTVEQRLSALERRTELLEGPANTRRTIDEICAYVAERCRLLFRVDDVTTDDLRAFLRD